jgi:hypothetical protein
MISTPFDFVMYIQSIWFYNYSHGSEWNNSVGEARKQLQWC